MRYIFTVSFDTENELTPNEIGAIADSLALQIEEPMDLSGKELNIKTSNIRIGKDSNAKDGE